MSAALTATAITVDYDHVAVLREVSLRLAVGEWLGVVGPNGAGKTTLLRCLAGVQTFKGSVTSDLFETHTDVRHRARAIAYVPQLASVPAAMVVRDFVMLGRRARLGALGYVGEGDRNAVDQALDDLELGPLAHRTAESLSGGERQRAVLAQALAQDTPILILDEPTTGLDIGHREQLLALLHRIGPERELSVVMSIHDLPTAASHCDRLLLLENGAVVSTGQPANVLTDKAMRETFGIAATVEWFGNECLIRRPR